MMTHRIRNVPENQSRASESKGTEGFKRLRLGRSSHPGSAAGSPSEPAAWTRHSWCIAFLRTSTHLEIQRLVGLIARQDLPTLSGECW